MASNVNFQLITEQDGEDSKETRACNMITPHLLSCNIMPNNPDISVNIVHDNPSSHRESKLSKTSRTSPAM